MNEPKVWNEQFEKYATFSRRVSEKDFIRMQEMYASTMELVMEYLMSGQISIRKKDEIQNAFLGIFNEEGDISSMFSEDEASN